MGGGSAFATGIAPPPPFAVEGMVGLMWHYSARVWLSAAFGDLLSRRVLFLCKTLQVSRACPMVHNKKKKQEGFIQRKHLVRVDEL